jgi:uncharacterized Zn finger protein
MMDLTINLPCPACGQSHEVELRRMRNNFPEVCPMCGHIHLISPGEAIRAHRLLEMIESEREISEVA